MTTGFAGLDKVIGGFDKGKLYILGGRAGMGKTSLAVDIARSCGKTVLYITLEPFTPQHKDRISGYDICLAEYCDESKCYGGKRRPLPFGKISKIRKQVLLQKTNIGLVIVDDIQLLKTKTPISELKKMAQEFELPVLALSQLKCYDVLPSRPSLDDIRSISREQAELADVIMFLYHEALRIYASIFILLQCETQEHGMVFSDYDAPTLSDFDHVFIAENHTGRLVNSFHIQNIDEISNSVNILRGLHEKYPANESIVGNYASGLRELTTIQFAESNDETYKEIFTELEKLSLNYKTCTDIKACMRHSFCVSTDDIEPLLGRFYDLREQHIDSERIAEAIAIGLVNLKLQTSSMDALMKIRHLLERIHMEYPNNVSIASYYAEELFYLAEELKTRDSSAIYDETLLKLKVLSENCPDSAADGCLYVLTKKGDDEYMNKVFTYGLTKEENELLKNRHMEFEFKDVSDCFFDLLALNSIAMIMNPDALSKDEKEQLISVYDLDGVDASSD